MSYDIGLYRIETREKEQSTNDENFFDNEENLVSFTSLQFQKLREKLLRYQYQLVKEDDALHFSHPDEDFGTALLTKNALYFTTGWNANSIAETGMTASEFTDIGEYAKYDFQNNGWEEI